MDEKKLLAAMMAATLLEHKIKQKEVETTDENFRTQAKEIGLKLKEVHLGYMDAGFTEEQAFELMMNALN